MNKKFLFAAMSLVALTACTNDEFESQKAGEDASPIQFEVINDAVTRASMDDNTIVWNANDGDIFTLYHGAALGAVTGYQNAIYEAKANPGGNATLTSPTMILEGGAIMVWPADTTFRIKAANDLTIKIPAEQTNIENNIPYVSDQVEITARVPNGTYNEAGYSRKYPVYMRPMASQLNIKADYAGTDETLATLYTGDDPIEEISVTSIDLLTDNGGDDLFTTEIPVQFTAANAAWTVANQTAWHSNWARITAFNRGTIAAAGQTDKLTTTCLDGNDGCKFLILPQKADIADGVDNGAVVVNTIYGKVVVADNGVQGSLYSAAEAADAWCRYIKPATAAEAYETKAAAAETSGDNQGKHKTTSSVANGLMQTLNVFSNYVAPATLTKITGEPMGTYANRYVKVLLTHLDMSGLHVKSDKQLRDAAKVWKKMGLGAVTVYLDGDDATDANGKFVISQKTIETINTINGAGLNFKVQPCNEVGEKCKKIVITGADYKQDVQNIAFITYNDVNGNDSFDAGTDIQADVELAKEATAWKWNSTATNTGIVRIGDGVAKVINKGTLVNAADVTLKTADKTGAQNDIELVNDGTWNITGGTLFVQFDVTNNGTVNISNGAEYRQDGAGHIFVNDATAKPTRFGGDDKKIGLVNNSGVFATVNTGKINNYGLIEHKHVDAKTYISANQSLNANGFTADADFGAAFNPAKDGAGNKMGMINLPWDNKNEDNISVSAALAQGFIAVTVDREEAGALDASSVGNKVNYVIVKKGVTEIQAVSAQVNYLEIAQTGTEIAWNVAAVTNYAGLMVLSKVNIKLGTEINATVTYLGADMYVGGTFNNGTTDWDGYYGDTTGNVATKYVTY